MSEFVSAYQGEKGDTVVTVSVAFAKANGLTVVKDDEPLDRRGRPRGPRRVSRASAAGKAATKKTTAKKTAAKKTAARKAAAPTPGGSAASPKAEEA